MEVESERRADYLAAYEAWQAQLAVLHRVLLEGEAMAPPALKGLLNGENRAKARYDGARRRLLGIEASLRSPFDGD